MQLSKISSIVLIIGTFIGFLGFEIYQKSEKKVIGIINPTQIEVDLNGNNILDDGEIICIPNLKAFTSDLSQSQPELENLLSITHSDAIKLGYLTDIFVENTLSEKSVKLKYTGETSPNCKYAEIIVENELYSKKLKNSGLGFKEKEAPIQAYKAQLTKAQKLKLIILNHKSNKYHTLDCKYGLIAHDAIVIPEKQKPEDAKPCKFCHVKQPKHHKYNLKTVNSSVSTYPLTRSSGSIRMYLTDLTSTLKPNNSCDTQVCHEVLNQINKSNSSIDIALYGWDDNPVIYNALVRAKARGVKIRIVYDTSSNSYYPKLSNFVKIANEKSTDSPKILMHNKFMIFDNSSKCKEVCLYSNFYYYS